MDSNRVLAEPVLDAEQLQNVFKDEQKEPENKIQKALKKKTQRNKKPPLKKENTKAKRRIKREQLKLERIRKTAETKAAQLANEALLKEYFHVKELSIEEQMQVVEKRREQHSKFPFNCELCYRGFTSQAVLNTHMVWHSPARGESECNICHVRYAGESYVRNHQSSIHKYQFSCQQCDFVSSSKGMAVTHAQWHNGIRFSCDICGEVLEKKSSLFRHMRVQHASDVVCNYCGQNFFSERGLISHINSMHFNEKQITDSQREQGFTEKPKQKMTKAKRRKIREQLKAEMLRKKAETKSAALANDALVNEFFHIQELSFEEQMQVAEKRREKYSKLPFKCEVCYRGFSSQAVLDTHMVWHSPVRGESECKICHVRYAADKYLRNHQSCVHKYQFSCQQCDFVTSSKVGAIIHAQWHNGVRFSCEICGLVVEKKSSLFKHMRVQHASNVECTYCGKFFLNERGLDSHINCLHFNEEQISSSKRQHGLTVKSKDSKLQKKEKPKPKIEMKVEHSESAIPSKKAAALANDALVKEYFDIKELSFEEQMQAAEKKREQYSKYLFKCEQCYRGFSSQAVLDSHMVWHSPARGESECEICHVRYAGDKYVRNHQSSVHKYQYSCQQCEFATSSKGFAVTHAQWHNGIKYACDLCGIVFEKKSSIFTHIRIHHPSNVVCCYCGYCFLNEKGLTFHINSMHFNEKQLEITGPWCNECDIQFYTENALTVHEQIKHAHITTKKPVHNDSDKLPKVSSRGKRPRESDTKPKAQRGTKPKSQGGTKLKAQGGTKPKSQRDSKHMLEAKGQQFSIYDAAVISKSKNVRVRIPPCEICGVQLNSWSEYRSHFNESHKDMKRTLFAKPHRTDLPCHHCTRLFQSNFSLKEHIESQHSDERQYICDICNKTFKTRSRMRHHRGIHNIDHSFVCTICGKGFNQKSNLARHIKYTHSDEKPFKCDSCGKCYKSKGELTLHVKHIHLKEPWPKRQKTIQTDSTSGIEEVEFVTYMEIIDE